MCQVAWTLPTPHRAAVPRTSWINNQALIRLIAKDILATVLGLVGTWGPLLLSVGSVGTLTVHLKSSSPLGQFLRLVIHYFR